MKFITYLIVFLLLTSVVLAGSNTGMDDTFDYLGIEKPNAWNQWSKQEKFTYLKSMSIYPQSGSSYGGKADTDGFFTDWLGVEQPLDWDSRTFQEKNKFVTNVRNGILPEEKVDPLPLKEVVETNPEEEFNLGNITSLDLAILEFYIEEENAETIQEEILEDAPTLISEQSRQKKTFQLPDMYIIISYLLALLVVLGSFIKINHPSRKIIRKGTFYVLPVLLLLFSFLHPERLFFREIGNVAERLLIFLLFVKPLAIIFKSKFFMRAVTYRRESGIASFWFFVFHAGGLIYVLKLTSISNYLVAFMFWGVVAGIGMLILAVTSNNTSIRYLKKNWKRLQYLTYPILLAVLIHSSLWVNGNLVKVYVVGGLFLVLKVGEYLVLKRRKCSTTKLLAP